MGHIQASLKIEATDGISEGAGYNAACRRIFA